MGFPLLATAPSPAPRWLADRRPGDRVVLRFAGERVRALKAA
jgi:hypothetical protein